MKEESGKCKTEEAKSGEGDVRNEKMGGERKAGELNGSTRSMVEDVFRCGDKSSVEDGDVARSIMEGDDTEDGDIARSIMEGAKGNVAGSIVKGDDTEDDVDDECGMKPWDRWMLAKLDAVRRWWAHSDLTGARVAMFFNASLL